MMTRVGKAKDWETGNELSMHLLGKLSRLEVHHVFPKDLLYKHGYSRPEVNALANFTFLTQETNLRSQIWRPASISRSSAPASGPDQVALDSDGSAAVAGRELSKFLDAAVRCSPRPRTTSWTGCSPAPWSPRRCRRSSIAMSRWCRVASRPPTRTS